MYHPQNFILAPQVLPSFGLTFASRGNLGDREMSCRDTIHLICWYLEGRLSSSVELEIRRHLETCPDCHLVLQAAVNTLDRYFNSEQRALAGEGAFRAA
ncbi:MAG: hypothetical protein DMG35_17790 [Acidobacteria bacterium]|nr:MAG: hypothetical protein AUH86_13670 [Acidobacteria bacterium 13_1_40CM_4_58_4]PYT58450.1 MAG: hypothetical protein DMG35_17790 [Acidobacteriota bacterium]